MNGESPGETRREATANSSMTAAVRALPPSGEALPVISDSTRTGAYQVGDALTTSNGFWESDVPITAYSYQWQRCNEAGCVTIAGATTSTYTLQSADVGFLVTAVVTAADSAGSASLDSAPRVQSLRLRSRPHRTQPAA